MAPESAITPAMETTNSRPAARLGGGFRLQAPNPRSGMITLAAANIRTARGRTRATVQAVARAYHQP